MVGRCFQEENECDPENTESTEDQRPEYAGFTQHGFRADKPPQRTEQFGIAYAGTWLLPGQEFTQQRYEREPGEYQVSSGTHRRKGFTTRLAPFCRQHLVDGVDAAYYAFGLRNDKVLVDVCFRLGMMLRFQVMFQFVQSLLQIGKLSYRLIQANGCGESAQRLVDCVGERTHHR